MRQITTIALSLFLALPAMAQDAYQIAAEKAFYPLTECPVSTNPLDGSIGPAIDVVHNGRVVRVCCKNCVEEVADNLQRLLGRIDRAHIRAQLNGYPLTTCAVDDAKLGTKGRPVELLHGIRLVRVCDQRCAAAFKKATDAPMKKIDDRLIAAQRKGYKPTTCPVSDTALKTIAQPQEVLFHTHLVKLCSKECAVAFKKAPGSFYGKLSQKQAKPAGKKLAVLHVEGMT